MISPLPAAAFPGRRSALSRFVTHSLMGGCLAMGMLSCAWAQQAVLQGASGIQITNADLTAELLRIPGAAESKVFSKPETVSAAASNLYTRRALAAEAEKAGLEQDPQVIASLRIARDRVLSDARIAQIDKAAAPDAAALEKYARAQYNAKPEQFRAPEEVRVRHILIRSTEPNAKATAEKLLADLKAGADFAALAKEKSGDPGSAAKGGDLGFIKKGQMVPAFEQGAFALQKPGELSPVVETNFGFHIIELEEKKPVSLLPFDEVKKGLMDDARAKVLEDARAAKSAALLKDAKFDEAAIEAFSSGYR
ncbi:peptidylprolyl isomerase [Xylophilus sp. GW821-FHT01B05]